MSTHGGKGDTPRPIADRKQFAENWDRAFGKKEFEEVHTKPKESDDIQVRTPEERVNI